MRRGGGSAGARREGAGAPAGGAGGPWTGLAAALLVAAPVLVGVVYTLVAALGGAGAGATGWSLERPLRVLSEPSVLAGVGWSLWIAGASTLVATLIAVALGLLFRGSGRLDRGARLLALLPLPIPHVVAAVGGVLILGQSGLLSRLGYHAGWLSSPADMPALVADPWGIGLILALVWKEVPFLALVTFSVLARSAGELDETARTLGATEGAVVRRVTLPLLLRGILPAVVAVFTFVVGTWEATALLAPSDPLALPLLTMERYTDVALANRGDAWVLALLALGIASVAVIVHEGIRARWGVWER